MPAPGDQYRPQAAAANPYEEQAPRISEFTAAEIATLASRLDKQLGPEYISSRPGAGGQKVHYLAAEKVINLANEVFGFNGWSSQIKNVQVDFCDEHQTTGRIDVGLSIIVRVTLKDGTFHEDLGYGHIENCKGKAAAFEKARKEAATDALKRTLRTFGNVLGNCLYDKEYLSRVTKVKAHPTSKWDPDNLYRHQEFAPPKKESEQMLQIETQPAMPPPERLLPQPGRSRISGAHDVEDEFGGDIFDEVELSESHSDGVVLPHPGPPQAESRRSVQAGPIQPRPQPQQNQHNPQQRVGVPPRNGQGPNAMQPPNQAARIPSVPHMNHGVRPHPSRSTPPNGIINQPPQLPAGHEPPVGFITGRCAEALTGDKPPPQSLATLQRFNPAAESPSIRKTSGVDHASSKPVSRDMLNGGASTDAQAVATTAAGAGAGSGPPQVTPMPNPPGQTTPRNFVNPAADANRRIGMPQSPMANRTSYKPPGPAAGAVAGVKRPAPRAETPGGDRAPLADVSNVAAAGAPISGPEEKRAKLGQA